MPKLVRIADCSELNWKVVAEYEVDELVSESEDEKSSKRQRGVWKGRLQQRKVTVRPNSRIFNKSWQTPTGSLSLLLGLILQGISHYSQPPEEARYQFPSLH